MAFNVSDIFVLPHDAAQLGVGDNYRLNKITDWEDPNPHSQDLVLEVVEVRDNDYLCKITELP